MCLPRPQFTLRQLIVAVAVVAVTGSVLVYIARKIRNPYFYGSSAESVGAFGLW